MRAHRSIKPLTGWASNGDGLLAAPALLPGDFVSESENYGIREFDKLITSLFGGFRFGVRHGTARAEEWFTIALRFYALQAKAYRGRIFRHLRAYIDLF